MNFEIDNFIIKSYRFNEDDILNIAKDKHLGSDFPVVYIIYKSGSLKKAYIGETINAIRRLKQHLTNPEKANLSDVLLFQVHYSINQQP